LETTPLNLCIALAAPPEEVFHALTDATEHSRFTGAESAIDPVESGAFSYLDGLISGTFRTISPPTRIVQSLRSRDWPDGHVATVTHDLVPQADGRRTLVQVEETGIPADQAESVASGWTAYWEKLNAHLRDRRVDIVERFVERYKNEHDWDCVDEFVSEDCKVHIPLPGLPQGREGMRINGRMVCTAFPDVQVDREFLIAEGDIVMERAHAKATHRGPLVGVEPSGKPVTWTELHAYRVSSGLISEVWSEPDLLGIMVQIGAVEMPAPK